MSLWHLALRSLANRRGTVLLTLLTIALAVALVLTVERLRVQARSSFTSTVSGTDLIVGARGGGVPLLLYTVFGIGEAVQNFSWDSYQQLREHPSVAWSVPIALGDSHRGFRVLATDQSYFEHYRYAGGQTLSLALGRSFASNSEAVLGARVAAELGYRLNQDIVLAHGTGKVSFADHRDAPFRVVGILSATGTPVDRSVHIDLYALNEIHRDWQSGVRQNRSADDPHDDAQHAEPPALSAALLGLHRRTDSLALQRQINEYREEPLTAILPAASLQQLWALTGVAERALGLVAALVVLAGLAGMTAALISTLAERRREMAVLRAVGAAPRHLFGLLMAEAMLLASTGIAMALLLFYALLWAAAPLAQRSYGLVLSLSPPTASEWRLLGYVMLAAALAALIPALTAYKRSLHDGLSPRL